MKKRCLCVAVLLLSLLFMGIQPALGQGFPAVQNEEPPILPEDPHIPGTLEGTGTYFALEDSEYLNITLESSGPVHLVLESVPEMIVMHLEAAGEASSAVISLGGFPSSTAYYKYEDDYRNEVSFATDESGRYTYTQDLGAPHLVFIQPRAGTKFIPWDTSIGTWDPVTRTYTLTTDVHETIQIVEDNLTLDGNGQMIKGPGWGFGVYLPWRMGVTIKNLSVKTFTRGIYLYRSSNNTLTGNTATSNSYYGIYLYSSSGNTLTGNTADSNKYYGIYLQYSGNNALTGNIATNSFSLGILLYSSNDNTLAGNTASNNTWHGIGLNRCYSGNNTLTDNTASNNGSRGMALTLSHNNILTGNTASNNRYGIALGSSGHNEIYNNNFINNLSQAYVTGGVDNLFNLVKPDGGNYWSDWTSPDEDPADGFVDYPYVFAGGQDNLPWTRQDGWENMPPVANANGPYVGDEGSPITFDGSGSSDPDGTIIAWEWDLDGDGEFDDATGPTPSYTWGDDYAGNIGLKVTDDDGATNTDTTTVTVENVAPTVGAITAPVDPVKVNMAITASGNFEDPGWLDTHTALWDWDDGSTSPGTVTESDGGGSVSGSHTYTAPGIYTVQLTVTDDDGGVGSAPPFKYVVVYDPAGGFVTGGGWIYSPAGAYTADPSLTGWASFGFVSQYMKGTTVPTGQTEFQYHWALTPGQELNFHSTAYDWLVVNQAGTNAQFKGSGTINRQSAPGGNDYRFMLWAGDDQPDTFRIRIWWEEGDIEHVVYDNGSDQPIGRGSIVIHK